MYKVKVNPASHIGQPVSGTGAKRTNVILLPYIHITYHHITLGKLNARNSGSNEFQTSASIAVTCHEARPFIRQKFVSIVSQQYFGRPTRLCPAGCQANILFIQRCPGNVAKYCATFQWCRKQSSDHVLDAACQVNTRTRSFQMWRTSCHGNVQSMLRGGPTTDRRSRRYATSILCRSLRYTVVFLRPRPKTSSPLACRPDLTWAHIRLFYKGFTCIVLDRTQHQFDDRQPEGATRLSSWQTHRGTSFDHNVFLDKTLGRWYSGVGCKFRFLKGICPLPLASTWEKFAWTSHLKHTWFGWFRNYRIGNLERSSDREVEANNSTLQAACDRMCFETSSLLCRVTVCHAEMEIESWRPWFWFVGWHAASPLIDLRFPNDILLFARSAMEVGKVLDSLVAKLSEVRLSVQCWRICYFDNVKPTAFNNHDWSWNNILGVLPGNEDINNLVRYIVWNFVHRSRIRLTGCLYLHFFCPGSRPKVGCLFRHANLRLRLRLCQAMSRRNGWVVKCTWIGTKICGPPIPSPTSRKYVSCQQMDFGRPDGSHCPAFSLFWCCCFIGCVVFANGHRTMYKEHIQTLDLDFRKFCRSIVRPPPTCYPTTFAHHYGVKPCITAAVVVMVWEVGPHSWWPLFLWIS